ncbi:hypothetical protein ACO2Q9_02330 [Variovorax sp. VNK109]|uniref:hypothetical protein n=1 Tax=Variovorax sp. VNK109 TaxID=3400919 RepID=UPI003BFB4ECA
MRRPARPFPFALRIAFVLVLMSLLLVRGWVGDAMAIGKVPAVHGATPAIALAADAPMPCHDAPAPASAHDMHAMVATDAAMNHDMPQHGSGDDCGTCTSCQVCHSSAVALLSGTPPAATMPQALAQRMTAHFASAEPQQGFKPPIS